MNGPVNKFDEPVVVGSRSLGGEHADLPLAPLRCLLPALALQRTVNSTTVKCESILQLSGPTELHII